MEGNYKEESRKLGNGEFGAPVYLRDLSKIEQGIYLDEWKRKGFTRLLVAYEKGDDIEVGIYLNTPKVV